MLTFTGVFNRFWGDLIIIKLVLEKFIETLFTSHQAFTLNSSWFIVISSCLELSEESSSFKFKFYYFYTIYRTDTT